MPPIFEPSSPNTVWIERAGNRIHARIPYWNGSGPDYAKSISGSNWSGTKKVWTYPLDLQVCRDFRDTFGQGLEIGPELWLWASSARTNEDRMGKLSAQNDAELFLVSEAAPTLAAAMASRTYQRVGARFIAEGGSVLIADQPGLGKTLETLAGLIESGANTVLVFAPKTALKSVWEREIQRWVPNSQVYVPTGTKNQRKKIIDEFMDNMIDDTDNTHSKFLVCNTEMVRIREEWVCMLSESPCNGKDDLCPNMEDHYKIEEKLFPELFSITWDAVVCDESHMALLGRKTQTRRGFVQLQSMRRIALSGTPYRGKIENFWGVLNWLNPSVFTSYWKWIKSYFENQEGTFGGIVIGSIMPHRQEAYDKMVKPYVLRRTKGEVASDLPPKMYAGTPLDPSHPEVSVGIWLEMEGKQAKCYAEMEREALAHIEGGDLTANGILAELTRLKQFSSVSWRYNRGKDGVQSPIPTMPSNKFDWLLEFMEERKGTGAKVVVASQYTSIINLFATEMAAKGHASYVLTGETKEQKRADIIAQFQDPADPTQIFFLNTKAGGVAVTLDQADELVFLDETYIPDDQEQVEDRIHRVSRMHNVTIYYLRTIGTVEEGICQVTGVREEIIKHRLDGVRGVKVARSLILGKLDGTEPDPDYQLSYGVATLKKAR